MLHQGQGGFNGRALAVHAGDPKFSPCLPPGEEKMRDRSLPDLEDWLLIGEDGKIRIDQLPDTEVSLYGSDLHWNLGE